MSAEPVPNGRQAGGMVNALIREAVWLTIAAVGGALAFFYPGLAGPVLVLTFVLLAYRLLFRSTRDALPVSAEAQLDPESRIDISAIDLAAAVPDPLVIFEPSSAIAYANDAARRSFGPLQEGMSLLLKFRAPEMQSLIASVIAGRDGPVTSEFTERVPFEATYRVTGAPIGVGTGLYFLLFKDQSESRKIDRMRADFIANASHELRTPLASISGFVETLMGPARNDAGARERFLKIMQSQTRRMSRLIDDLLSLSRLEMKSHARPTMQVNLQQVMESVLDTLKPLSDELAVAIETDFKQGDAIVLGDRDELFQVFENLVENACKYGQSGGRIVVSIMPHRTDSQDEICVSVKDFGPGIPAEHIPRITERFYRIDVESSRAQKGTGLGLSIVKHILTRHGARLAVRSEVGQGAEFSVYFLVN